MGNIGWIDVLMAACISLPSSALLAAAGPISVGCQKPLFVDRKFIASSKNVFLKVNPPIKRPDAIMKSDKPWELIPAIPRGDST